VDRFGLGWRDDLAAGIFANLDRIDIVEVLADDYADACKARLRALRTLAIQVPVTLHGVSLGLASTESVEPHRLDALARVVNAVQPAAWSEHFAFVRGGGVEIGHLAAPPRNAATIEGAGRNADRAARIVGSRPLLENVATLIDPPASDRDEATWLAQAQRATRCDLLLDLHNLHANATNFGFDAMEFLDAIPLQRVRQVHLAGGKWIVRSGVRRLLDDHQHDVPDSVYALLREVASRAADLDVILERDGAYPGMDALLAQLDRARCAVAEGRERRRAATQPAVGSPGPSGAGLEAELARLYRGEARACVEIGDAVGLAMAVESFRRKRASTRAAHR